jgi:uncharacterized DUF497 family protein
MIIAWDPAKDRANQRKHGISFDVAKAVFEDPDRVEDFDDREYGEERWGVIGRVGSQIVYVVYTERGGGLRLISARKAARREEARYFGRTLH